MARHETRQAYVVGSSSRRGLRLAPPQLSLSQAPRGPHCFRTLLILTPAGEVWRHLWRTQLVELMTNTVLLLAGVGGGTLVVGTGLAWLVVYHRFLAAPSSNRPSFCRWRFQPTCWVLSF